MEETHAIAGTAIVENPKTGEILALTNRPTFNPNIRKEIRNEALKDRAVSDVYEPGSTFKMVTISAGLEEKITRPDEMFDCQMGSIVINGMRIRDSKPHGVLPSPIFWLSRVTWARSKSRCAWETIACTNTFARSASVSKLASSFPAKHAA